MRDKTFKTIGIILTSILALVFVASLAGFIVLPLVTFILILVPDLIFLIILAVRLSRKRYTSFFICSVVFTLVLTFHMLFWAMFHMPVAVNTSWQYPIALKYSNSFKAIDTVLPEELPGSAKDVYFEFMPTILQGAGHIAVGFTADETYVKDLEDEVRSQAVHIGKYNEYGCLELSNQDPGSDKVVYLWEGDIREKHPDATVYVIYSNYDWNHPHSKAVFIDGNYVFFSEE